ncbi:MAG: hypothetical protein U0V87_08705 [Acidobacteriota bacterium]
MEPLQSDFEERLDQIAARLERVERQLSALHGQVPFAFEAGDPEAVEPVEESDRTNREGSVTSRTPALIGRSLLVLAGAFAIRSVTEAGTIPPMLGVALGVAFGALWLWLADRAARHGDRLSATTHAITAVVVILPLLVEATVRFKFLAPLPSAIVLVSSAAAVLALARSCALPSVVWIGALGPAVTALALAFATRNVLLFASALFVIAALSFWAGLHTAASTAGWAVVGILDVLLLMITAVLLIAPPERSAALLTPPALIATLLALVTLSFATFIGSTRRTGRSVRITEIVQGIVATLVGFGGALAVTHRSGAAALATGVIGLVLAAATYAASFTFIDRIEGRRTSFMFYTSAALIFTLLGAVSIWHDSALAIVVSVAALATAWIGSRKARETLSLHATIYILAAAAVIDLDTRLYAALVARSGPQSAYPPLALWLVLVVAAVFCWLPIAGHGRTWGAIAPAAKLLVMIVLLGGLEVVVLALGCRMLAGDGEHPLSGATLAVVRTALLSISAVLVPLIARSPRWREARWLTYPILILAGIKLVAEDVPSGQTAVLVLSFALYGGALILAPRLARQSAPSGSSNS